MEFNENDNLTQNTENKQPDKKENGFLPYLKDIVFLITGVLLVFSLLFRFVIVSGPSMKDTHVDGDWLVLLGNVLYNDPQYGDIVVISKDSYNDGTPIIKRVIATEGQTVDIDFAAGIVYVDGEALDEPYTRTPTNQYEGVSFPLTVADECVFVLGDNRNESKDSRSIEIGLVDKREILGKAIFIMIPGDDGGELDRDFSRIGVID